MTRPTIKDVSRLASVSIGTVSNVVNGHPNVSERTRTKVLDAIDKLGYQANRAARSLPAGQTGLLGYRLPDEPHPNPAMDVFLHQVVEHASSYGLELLLFAPKAGQSEIDAIASVQRRGGVDAFVLAGVDYHDPRIEYLSERDVPFAVFGRLDADAKAAWVDVDGAAGTRSAVNHLFAMGRKSIGFVGWPEGSLTGDERHKGWRMGMEEHGFAINEDHIFRSLDNFSNGRQLASSVISSGVDAVVCVTDELALGLMVGLREKGVIPGGDIALVGFDNIPASAMVQPGLSTIKQPMGLVGEALVVRLAEYLSGESTEGGLLLEPELVIRGSSSQVVNR